MKKGVVLRSGIHTHARWWGYSHTKEGWIFGYTLHLTCTTAIDEIVVPLTAEDVTTTATNVPDNRIDSFNIFFFFIFDILFIIGIVHDI